MIVYVLILLAFAAFIGLVMECYKKVIRKDEAFLWEIRIIAMVLSALFAVVVWKVTDVTQLSALLTGTPWMIITYTVIIYLLQKPACMVYWKPLLKKWLDRKTS